MIAARKRIPKPQNYPRISNEDDPFHSYLDDSKLVPHSYKIPEEQMKNFIKSAITAAQQKSGRVILNIPEKATEEEFNKICIKQGIELFKYFKKYCGDPAATAYDLNGKHFEDICKQQFFNRTLQKERMNSGWRYQFLARDCASHSKRFAQVADIGTAEADFNAVINYNSPLEGKLSLYVSIKNRVNTLGGQDWPKAIQALESVAINDKNRDGPYCCVFGIAMDRGLRHIKVHQKMGCLHSCNTEIWMADFFWPFFSNCSYEEIMLLVLNVLIEMKKPKENTIIKIPKCLIDAFGECCKKTGLIDEKGIFNNPHKLVNFFCRNK